MMVVMGVSEELILHFITEAPTKVSFCSLRQHFCKIHQTSPGQLKTLVANLIQAGKLCYTSYYGCSFIEISYNQPTAVSEHVVIEPTFCSGKSAQEQIVITLRRGAAFGGGEHPSTRLAIQMIDSMLNIPELRAKQKTLKAVDIGTGSGVLAIVAAKMGVGFVCGIDIDPCAVYEARDNVRLNGLEDRVMIIDDDLESLAGPYNLVLANLRMPTLFKIRSVLEKKLAMDSGLIFSGIKSDEAESIGNFYEETGFFVIKKKSEKGWTALCLARGCFLNDRYRPLA